MVKSQEAREKAAKDIFGRFHSSSPKFAELVNKLVDPLASEEFHLSAIREALHKIALGECEPSFNAEVATAIEEEKAA